MRQGSRQRWAMLSVRLVAVVILCAAGRSGAAQSPTTTPPATSAANSWATGGVAGTPSLVGTGSGSLAYWQAPPLPTAVIQGGAIPSGWAPQAVPYQGVGPDGRPLTMYYSPTYVFTYPIGPPVLAASVVPAASQVNRRQALNAAPQPASMQGWNYQTQGAPPATYALPPATVARYQPVPYQYPPGSRALSGTPIVPPQGTLSAPALAPAPLTQPPTQWGPGQQATPSGQWAPSSAAPPPGVMPQSQNTSGEAFAAAAPPMVAGSAAAIAAATQPSAAAAPPASPFPSPISSSSTPAQPVSLSPQSPTNRSATPHLWRVVGVHDGDTVTCLDESNQQQKVRLAEIDAPEIGQEYGKVSREALAEMVFGKTVEVADDGKDRYGRWIAHLSVNGVDVNRQMIAGGNAWHYEDYSRDASLAALQAQAQSQRLGLWAQSNPIPPWTFRKSGQ